MKKRACVCLVLVCALVLSGCGLENIFRGRNSESPPLDTPMVQSGMIGPTELVESELGVLNLYGVDASDWDTFYYVAPDGIVYVMISWQ